MKYYTGIGSRRTPQSILQLMTKLAKALSLNGYCLRSGGADGADLAFQLGAKQKEIYIPWPGFNNHYGPDFICDLRKKHFDLAASIHPAWDRCTQGAKKLHARNTQQVLGKDLNSPSEFIICWTPNGQLIGGTATAMSLAINNGITVYNLAIEKDKNFLLSKYMKIN